LFEPVAVAAYGPLLAVADRGNGRVLVLDSYTLATIDGFDVENPRDLDWGDAGELFVLNEKGELYSRYPVGASADTRMAAEGMKEAWSLSWADDGLIVASVSGRTWWNGRTKPGRSKAFGAVALHDPWIEERDGTDMLMLRGAATSTFHDFIQGLIPMTQVVWRGEARPSRVVAVGPGLEGATRFYSPAAGSTPDGDAVAEARTVDDVVLDIAKISREGEHIPKVVVLDSRISGTDGQLELFLAFLLQQGVRLDLWASNRPAPPEMCRISRITLGRTYYAPSVKTPPFNESVEWVLSMPLPPDVASFGYPSDITLSLMAEIDTIRFADWIPVWPSLIDRNRPGEGVGK
jgi:hypothetical protein